GGCVVAGGGGLGAVEVGMVQALAEARVRPDFVVGSSAGAVNATFFAGRPDLEGVQALRDIWVGLRSRDVFPVSPIGGLLGALALPGPLVDPGPFARPVRPPPPDLNPEDPPPPLPPGP